MQNRPAYKFDESGFIDDWWNPSTWGNSNPEPVQQQQQGATIDVSSAMNPYASYVETGDKLFELGKKIYDTLFPKKQKTVRVSKYQSVSPEKVTVFADPDFSGVSMSLEPGAYDIDRLKSAGLNDKISAIKVPPGMYADVYKDPLSTNEGGAFIRIDKSIAWLKEIGQFASFEDKISAIKVYGAWNGSYEAGYEPIETVQEETNYIVPLAIGGTLLTLGIAYYVTKK